MHIDIKGKMWLILFDAMLKLNLELTFLEDVNYEEHFNDVS